MRIDAVQPLQRPAEAYRRQARRLRHRFRHDPARLHEALAHAARIHDQARALILPPASAGLPAEIDPRLPGHMVSDAGAARRFAGEVAASLEEGLLRYSQRLQLIRQAARHGIGRFEANLIIAAVQHQLGGPAMPRPTRRRIVRPPAILLALAVETVLIVWLCWMMG